MDFTTDEENAILACAGFVNDRAFVERLDSLRDLYRTPERHYHTFQHAMNVLAWSNTASLRLFNHETRLALGFAALHHDAVYDTKGSPDNERRSADLLSPHAIMARHLIQMTAFHGEDLLDTTDVSDVAAYFLDCDMAAFLCDPRWEVVLCNDRNIRKELREKYSAEEVREGRADFLKKLYMKRHIFLSKHFQKNYEHLARENLWHLVYGGLYEKNGGA